MQKLSICKRLELNVIKHRFVIFYSAGLYREAWVFSTKESEKQKKTNMKLLIITACLLAYVATYPVSQLEDNKEIAETADKITESIDETLPPQNG